MKTKLTLSISEEKVWRIKAYSARHKKSVSQLVEEFIEGITKPIKDKRSGKQKTFLVDQLDGILTGKFSEEDLENDPRLARIMGKR